MGRFLLVSLVAVFLFSAGSGTAWAGASVPSDQDTDGDGIPDIDERALVVNVSAGPSVQEIYQIASGLIAQAHQDLVLEVTGTIDAGNGITSGPDGRPDINPIFPRVLPSAPFLALLGRIDNGEFFLIGSETVITVTETGTLFMTVNEVRGQYNNNSGAFTARIGKDIGTDPGKKDTDLDSVNDGIDDFPLDRSEWVDTDGDGIGNNADLDDDGDTLSDIEEMYGTFSVPAGPTDPITLYRTGIQLSPGAVIPLSVTGTIVADGILSITSTPEGRPDIDTSTVTTVDNSKPYLSLLARFGNQGPWRLIGSAGEMKLKTILNGGFESGNLNGWTVENGTAFVNQPTLGPNRGQDTFVGDYWIGTFEDYQGQPGQSPGDIQGDGPTGAMVSNPFTLYGDGLSFLIGGGNEPWPSSTAISANLVEGSNILQTTTGQDSEAMRRVTLDVRSLRYRDVQMRLYDRGTGLWGHINFDDMYQSNLSGMPVLPGLVRAELVLAVNDIVGNFASNTGEFVVTVGDGITSNPLLKDTDGDSFEDDEELFWGTDPNNPNDFPVPEIVVLPAALDFGNVDVDTIVQENFRIRNDGVANLVIDEIRFLPGSSTAFSFPAFPTLPLILGTGTQSFIPVNFSPAALGTATATIAIVSNDPDIATATLALSGSGQAGLVSASTDDIDFGSVRAGTDATVTVTLMNTGNKDITFSSVGLLPDPPVDFALQGAPTGGAVLPPASGTSFVVSFLPSAAQARAATVRIVSDAYNAPVLDILLAGQGIAPEIEVTPSELDFGVTSGGSMAEDFVIVRNVGNADLILSGITITGETAFSLTQAPALPDILAPSAERSITVAFEPLDAGIYLGALQIDSDDTDEPTVEVTLSGLVPTPTPTETPSPTFTPTSSPTSTPSPSPTATITPTSTPTLPSPTPSSTPTDTPTPEPATPTPTATPEPDPDLDGSGVVDGNDLLIFFGASQSGSGGDINNDGVTDYVDLFLMQAAWEGQ